MRFLVRTVRYTSQKIPVRAQPRLDLFSRPAVCHRSVGRLVNSITTPSVSKPPRTAPPDNLLRASAGVFGLAAVASLALVVTLSYSGSPGLFSASTSETASSSVTNSEPSSTKPFASCESDLTDMTTELPPGRVGNLTPEQEDKLRQLWTAIFRIYHYDLGGGAPGDATNGAEAIDDDDANEAGVPESVSSAAVGDKKKEKKRKRDIFKRSKKDSTHTADESVASVTKAVSTVDLAATSEDDKYGQSKLFQEALASQSPESIRNTIWSMVKHDHPDALVLRFLRARKWDVDKALVMLVSTMHWRAQDMHVDDDIMAKGEGGAAEEVAGSADEKAKTLSEDFLAQMRMGKSFLHGADKQGRPICIVRVRLHHQGDQLEESVERCTVYTIETARMALHPPVDTAVSSHRFSWHLASTSNLVISR